MSMMEMEKIEDHRGFHLGGHWYSAEEVARRWNLIETLPGEVGQLWREGVINEKTYEILNNFLSPPAPLTVSDIHSAVAVLLKDAYFCTKGPVRLAALGAGLSITKEDCIPMVYINSGCVIAVPKDTPCELVK